MKLITIEKTWELTNEGMICFKCNKTFPNITTVIKADFHYYNCKA